MNFDLSPSVSRSLAIAILIALIASLYFGIVQPLADTYLGNQQRIAQLQDAVAKYRNAAKELPALQAQLAALNRDESSAAGFLRGPNETLIAADIQNRVKSLADAAKLDLRTSQVLPGEAEGKLKRIAVREQLAGTIGGILTVFHDIEAGASPLLFIDNVTMRARPIAARANTPARAETIDVQFDVYGYAGAG